MNREALTILHVEDNPDHLNLIIRTLQKHRVANRVHLVEDGEAALDCLFRRSQYADPEKSPRPRPHLILLDLRIPKIDGQEVLRVIKATEELLTIPIVVLTSSETEKDIAREVRRPEVEAYEHHANSYLVKPVGFEAFTEMMECLGSYWLAWNLHPSKWHGR